MSEEIGPAMEFDKNTLKAERIKLLREAINEERAAKKRYDDKANKYIKALETQEESEILDDQPYLPFGEGES